MRMPSKLFATALVGVLTVGAWGCAAPAQSDGATDQAATTESAEAAGESTGQTDAYKEAMEGKGVVSTFIGEDFYDGSVKNSDDALKAIQSVMDRIGGDDTTVLESVADRSTETGTTYYAFQQQAGDIMVRGASVKLIADKDGKAVGLVSSILPNVKVEPLDNWAATQEKAEEVVRDFLKNENVTGIDVIAGATEQTLIAVEDRSDIVRYAWVVYTRNYHEDDHVGYLAHYVNQDGEYLYNIPVTEPGNTQAALGEAISFDFDKYQQDEWSGNAVLHDGSEKQITVPVLKDSEGTTILGDAKRKVLCADYASFVQDGKVVPIQSAEDEFQSIDMLVYNTYLRIWDFYDSIGWTGPDSLGSASLLLMNYVDENGDPIDNAIYMGRSYGWQVFGFTRLVSFGECTDVMAHEFTHCVTGSTMTGSLYFNDTGAINEGMSDVLGNLVEILMGDSDGAWTHGEGAGEATLTRSLKDPHAFNQPEYAYDAFYETPVAVGNNENDQGGVHTNSSMLNIVSYKLDQAGMSAEDQLYFWMNVALAMTPNSDYPLLAELLPWCMKQSGFDQYVEPLKAAIDEAKFTTTKAPEGIPAGCGLITLQCPDQELSDAGNFVLYLFRAGVKGDARFWPVVGETLVRAVVVPGDYRLVAWSKRDGEDVMRAYTDDGWQEIETIEGDGGPTNATVVHVEEGKTIEIPSEGMLG